MYDIRHLRYFVAVATERSFTRGAERLHMAQPPLSRRIQEIEEELGAKLFDREARPLALTPAGRLFYDQAIQVIQRAEQMRATMTRFIASDRPRFTIGIAASMLYARLPDVVRRFRAQAPQIDLNLIEMNSAEQMTALKEGRIHAGFGRLRRDDPVIASEVLREEPLVLALPPDHALRDSDEPVSLQMLETLPLLLYPRAPRSSYADFILSLFIDIGIHPAEIIEVRELQTALVMTAAGAGVCIVPESISRSGRHDLAFRPLAGGVTVPLVINYRAEDRSTELRTLFRVFVDAYREWDYPLPASIADAAA